MPKVYVGKNKKQVDLTNPSLLIGSGGEADVWKLTQRTVAKLFKGPDHADFKAYPAGDPIGQSFKAAAKERISEHQQKLPAFPFGLPSCVVCPSELVYDRSGKIIGYTMPFVSGAEVLYRLATPNARQMMSGGGNDIVRIFIALHEAVRGLHGKSVVIGDFNDLNVLVKDVKPFLIDADSYQYGSWKCRVFTEKFIDPLLCDPSQDRPVLDKPYVASADWYAYAVMLMRCSLYCGPYDGIHKPKDRKARVPFDKRSLARITVADKDVVYPKNALSLDVLPDELVQYLLRVFKKDLREEFPARLIQSVRWTNCTKCGKEHAKVHCPFCTTSAPAAIKQRITVRGVVTATRIFECGSKAMIVHASLVDGNGFDWLWWKDGNFYRGPDKHQAVATGALERGMRFRLMSKSVILATNERAIVLSNCQSPVVKIVDMYVSKVPVFDVCGDKVFWAYNGGLWRSGDFADEIIGSVLAHRTLFWCGKDFGFGFSSAGQYNIGFVFQTGGTGLNDSVQIRRFDGQIMDATCYFCRDLAWFIVTMKHGSRLVNRCTVVNKSGAVVAEADDTVGSAGWLGSARSKCGVGGMLLAATDDGIVRVEIDSGNLVETKRFADTEKFVSRGCHLFAAEGGLYVVTGKQVLHLKVG